MSSLTLRPLSPEDAAAWLALRLVALRDHPRAFLASPSEDEALGVDGVAKRFAEPADRAVVIGAFVDGALVGNAGVVHAHKLKQRHTAILWGMYVTPEVRGAGVGSALVSACIDAARAMPGVERLVLSVDTVNLAAKSLYVRHGFVSWGIEPDAFRTAGGSVDEEHMILRLDGALGLSDRPR